MTGKSKFTITAAIAIIDILFTLQLAGAAIQVQQLIILFLMN